jgi:hypothetical protein
MISRAVESRSGIACQRGVIRVIRGQFFRFSYSGLTLDLPAC